MSPLKALFINSILNLGMTRTMSMEEILDFKRANENRIMAMRGVNGCGSGAGFDWRTGRHKDVLKIYVEYLTPQTARIQKEMDFEGIPTEVVELGRISAF